MSNSKNLNWRSAFSEKTTGVAAVPGCLTSGDVFGDGDHRILIISLDQRLLCFEGPRMTHEIALPDMPSSVCVHYSGNSQTSIPLVAVGAGNSIYFFLNLRQYSKFVLPPPFKSEKEEEIYKQFIEANLTLTELQQELARAKEQEAVLCPQSLAFLVADLSTKQATERYRALMTDISSTDCITALSTIKNNAVGEDLSTHLLVGTESRTLLLLDAKDSAVEKKWELGAPASSIRTQGYLTGSSLIAVITRDRSLRIISNLSDHITQIPCESLPVDVAISSGNIYVALVSKLVKIFDPVGKLLETVSFEEHIISLAAVSVENRQFNVCCVATANGNMTFIDNAETVSTLELEEGISAMYFGRVGREPENLLTISKHGGLFLRTLSRVPSLTKQEKKTDTNTVSPLPIPKKTNLFLEQCKKERANAEEMYDDWKNSLRYIYLLSSNTYAQILEDSVVSPIDNVSFSVKVLGMGPDFLMNVTTINSGSEAISNIKVIPKYNKQVYKVNPAFIDLPTMVGGYQYTAKFNVESIERDGKSDVINVIAISPQYTIPFCSSIVQIPVSQFPIR